MGANLWADTTAVIAATLKKVHKSKQLTTLLCLINEQARPARPLTVLLRGLSAPEGPAPGGYCGPAYARRAPVASTVSRAVWPTTNARLSASWPTGKP